MNYSQRCDEIINQLTTKPKLLLHSCCAPCSSYTLLYLAPHFDITVYYYNPNIEPVIEFKHRMEEEKRFISTINQEYGYNINCIEGEYDISSYKEVVLPYKDEPERGKRCYLCYLYRLKKTALLAKKLQMDYFCTTLSISPFKNADWINEIGEKLEKEIKIPFLPSDFKKHEGYKKSIELSKAYNLYRQNYCGCIYSRKEEQDEKKDN